MKILRAFIRAIVTPAYNVPVGEQPLPRPRRSHPRAERAGEIAAWTLLGIVSGYAGIEVFRVLGSILRGHRREA